MKRKISAWKVVAVAAAIAAVCVASIAIAQPSSDNKSKGDRANSGRNGEGPGRPLQALAKQLGVSTADLRKALQTAHEQVGPPSQQERQQLQQSFEQHCTTVTDALGKALNKSGDDVRNAIKSVAKDRVEYAVDHGRLTRSQA